MRIIIVQSSVIVLMVITGCSIKGSAENTTVSVPSPTMNPHTPVTPLSESTDLQNQEIPSNLIAFASDQDGDFEIWVMNLDGSDQHQLTDNDAMDISPSWSPDGSRIAFVSNRDGNDEIYIMNADGSNLQRLTETPDASESFPAWSPDGTSISFDTNRDGNWEIYVMNADGSNIHRLTDDPADDWITSWSPDGSQIVFESKRDGNYEIYVMNADGSNQRRLTDHRYHDGFPSWSPDGSQIAFMSRRDGNYEIYLMDPDGSNLHRVTNNPASDSDPAWSSDGKRLVFVSQRGGNDEIFVIAPDGSNLQQLTENGAQNWSPSFQPIAATASPSNTWINTLTGPSYGAFFDITLTEDGNILAVGATNHLHFPPYSGDALMVKFNLNGEIIWEQVWGGNGYEQAWSVTVAEDGGYYIFGETDSFGAGDRDFFLLKTDEAGNDQWYRTFGGSRKEWPFGMLPLTNGDLLLHGFSEPLDGSGRNQYAIRVGPNGDVIWEYLIENTDEEIVAEAIETSAGDLILVVITEEDGKLVKLDQDGQLLWERRYELPGWQFASTAIQTDEGGFLLAGFIMGENQQADTWIAYSASNGELEWESSYGDPSYDDYAQSLISLNDGSYLIGKIGNGMPLSCIDPHGNVLWEKVPFGQDVYGAEALIELEDGGYLIAGFIQISSGRSYDAILLRTDAEGRIDN